MDFLLDTNVFLHATISPDRLNRPALKLLADRTNSLFLSAASAWEIVIKHSLGRLRLPDPPARWLTDRLRLLGLQTLGVTVDHTIALSSLPPFHRDPFDRILIAQAASEHLTLLTTDRRFREYSVEAIPGAA